MTSGEVLKTAACGPLLSFKPSVASESVVLLQAQVAGLLLSSLLGFVWMCLCKNQWLSSSSGFLFVLLVASPTKWLQAQVAVDLSCKPTWLSCLHMLCKISWICKVFVLFHTCFFCAMFEDQRYHNSIFEIANNASL